MSWGALLGGIAGGLGGIAGAFDNSGDDAAKAMEAAQRRMEARMDRASEQLEGEVDNYYENLDRIEREFDPYDMTEAFASFHEGVIQPMNIEFEEYILPSIKTAYSGGVFGAETSQSGAAKESELKARQRKSTAQGTLRAGEREKTIGRNIDQNRQDQASAADRLQAGTLAPSMRSGQAGSIFQAEQSAIETRYAADRSKFESILGIPSAIISGVDAGQSIQAGLDRMRGVTQKQGDSSNRGDLRNKQGVR